MDSIIRAAIDLRNFKYNLDDDLVDRLNRQYTSAVMVIFAILVSARQYFGEAMHCWCPEVRRSNSILYTGMCTNLTAYEKRIALKSTVVLVSILHTTL